METISASDTRDVNSQVVHTPKASPFVRTSRHRNLLSSTGSTNGMMRPPTKRPMPYDHLKSDVPSISVISSSPPTAPLSPHYGHRVPLTPAPTPVSSPFVAPRQSSDAQQSELSKSDGVWEEELVSKAVSKLNSGKKSFPIRQTKSEENFRSLPVSEKLQEAINFLTTQASGVKDASMWVKGKKPLEYIHYETLRDHATVDDCRKWALTSESPILRIYAVMALAEGNFINEEEQEQRKRTLEEVALALFNDRESVEIQFGCVATFASVGDEVCGLALSFLDGPDRLKLAEELLRLFVSGQFEEPELSLGLLERCVSLLVARKNFAVPSLVVSPSPSPSPSPSSSMLSNGFVTSTTPLLDAFPPTNLSYGTMEVEESAERQRDLQQLIHQSREALRSLGVRIRGVTPVKTR